MSDQVPFLDAVWFAQARQSSALGEMVTGRRPTSSAPRPTKILGFDGGARRIPAPPPPSHEETLVAILRGEPPPVGPYVPLQRF